MSKRPTEKCRLCLEERVLCKSHIIPDFMYQELFDEEHKLVRVKLEDMSDRLSSTGEYEYLLCEGCEKKISGYETYASTILYGGILPKGSSIKFENRQAPDGLAWTHVEGLDYGKFKLFLLSILWRASVSKRAFFNHVHLGPYEGRARLMILNDDPGKAHEFPCILSSYLREVSETLPREMIGQPIRVHDTEGYRYTFLIGGVLYFFLVSPETIKGSRTLLKAAADENNELKILHMNREQARMMLTKFTASKIKW